MYTGRTAESVRQVKGRGADIQNMALEWRTERKGFSDRLRRDFPL